MFTKHFSRGCPDVTCFNLIYGVTTVPRPTIFIGLKDHMFAPHGQWRTMREGALYALFSLATVASATATIDVLPRQKCDPLLSNHTMFDYSLDNIYQNASLDLSQLRGKLTLVVNVATYWGYVTQYHGLNALKSTHGAEGFEVVGVPCNQFHMVSYNVLFYQQFLNQFWFWV